MLQPGQMPLNPQGQAPGVMYSMLAGGNPSVGPLGQGMGPGGQGGYRHSPIMQAMNPQRQQMFGWRQRFNDWQAQNPGQSIHSYIQSLGGFPALFGRPAIQPQTQVPPAPAATSGFAATTNPQPGVAY